MSTNREFMNASFFRKIFPETKWNKLPSSDYNQVCQRLRQAGQFGFRRLGVFVEPAAEVHEEDSFRKRGEEVDEVGDTAVAVELSRFLILPYHAAFFYVAAVRYNQVEAL